MCPDGCIQKEVHGTPLQIGHVWKRATLAMSNAITTPVNYTDTALSARAIPK